MFFFFVYVTLIARDPSAEPLDEREEAGLVATGKSLLWPLVDVINQTRRLVSDGVVPADPEREELCAAIEGHTEVLAAATAAANEALAMSHAVALEESEALSAPADGTHEIGCGVFGCDRLRFGFFFSFLMLFLISLGSSLCLS